MSARNPSSRRVIPGTSEEVPEADRFEQEIPVTPDEETASSRPVSASDIFANEADIAEQLLEVPEDDEYPHA